jgi:hypothetical protein
MATHKHSFFTNPLAIVAFGAVMALAVACGDDDDSSNPAPAGGSKNNGGSGGSSAGKSNTGGTNNTGGETNAGGMPNIEPTAGSGAGTVETMGGAAGAGGAAPDCTDEADSSCYSCKPKTMDQYLNHCPTTGCKGFDNSTLTSFVGDKLPKLP